MMVLWRIRALPSRNFKRKGTSHCLWHDCRLGCFVAYCLLDISNYTVLLSERASERVSVTIESDPTTLISIRYSLILETSPETEFSSDYFTEMLFSYIMWPSVVKYGILSNNMRGKLHAVIDCLFLWVCWRDKPNNAGRTWEKVCNSPTEGLLFQIFFTFLLSIQGVINSKS
mgnify:CR=1 FL=1